MDRDPCGARQSRHGRRRGGRIQNLTTLTDDVLLTLGSAAWIVAVVGAAVACRRAGAPMTVVVLLALSVLVAVHAPPVGPIALLCFAAAAALLARSRKPSAVPALKCRATRSAQSSGSRSR